MIQIIDRRLNGRNKSAVNRERFIRRFKRQIRKAATDAIAERSVTDLVSGEKVGIPVQDISEPVFRHGAGGRHETVHPGNTDFIKGDELPRPTGAGGGGSGDGNAGNDGEGEDTFAFHLSRDEFLELFFEDLELPNLEKTKLETVMDYCKVRAGYSRDGVPSNIDVIRSLQQSLARRIALQGPHRRKLAEAEENLAEALAAEACDPALLRLLEDEVRRLKNRIRTVPFIDTFDLRYRNRVRQPKPKTQAVMFCLMDVSGSMDQQRKDIAKRFFIVLYFFLTRAYEHIQVVFIRHHTTAKEVDEKEFFHALETGGTVVSSALKLMNEIIEDRYPVSDWNIYGAQASDGDNWGTDSPNCSELLLEHLLPKSQYFAYVQISADKEQGLWQEYATVAEACDHFAMRKIATRADIYPVFRDLMKKRET